MVECLTGNQSAVGLSLTGAHLTALWSLSKGRFTLERIHNTKEQIIFYERAEKHKSKERTILSFKRALFPGNDQSGYNERGKWLNTRLGSISCVLIIEDSYIMSALPEDHCCSKHADYLFENYVTSHSHFPPEMWA